MGQDGYIEVPGSVTGKFRSKKTGPTIVELWERGLDDRSNDEGVGELPRFIQGLDFIAGYFRSVGEQTSVLSQAAQNLDFAEVDGNPLIMASAVERLREALNSSSAPVEIVEMYRDLYDMPAQEDNNEQGDTT